MSIFRFFIADYDDTKRIIRTRIEEIAEEEFEKYRRDAYAKGMIEFVDDIEVMTNNQKEELRVENVKDLEKSKNRIAQLWDLLASRTAKFQIMFSAFLKIGTVAALLCFFFGYRSSALAIFVIVAVAFVISLMKGLFSKIMYVFNGSFLIMEELIDEYEQYGYTEAALCLADYRNISRSAERRNEWIFTPTHKNPPS
ncbi:hypothetical protein J6W91_01450 [Candidatus Saccharibacteria bacterium]|nr:hypothetical protein [Candidatus Saccharibacteria bacterium]